MDEGASDDAMIVVAALVSRVEALVVATMLEAAGILVHVGGAAHASVEVNSLALGGHRLWVPAWQHRAASEILLEVLDDEEWGYCCSLRRAVLRVLALWSTVPVLTFFIGFWQGVLPGAALLMLRFQSRRFLSIRKDAVIITFTLRRPNPPPAVAPPSSPTAC